MRMTNGFSIKILILCLAAVLSAASLSACSMNFEPEQKKEDDICKTSLFIWHDRYMLPEEEERLQKVMKYLECEAIYQCIPHEAKDKQVLAWLQRRADAKQDVYYLTGAPEWVLEKDAKSMHDEMDRVIKWNKAVAKSTQAEGAGGAQNDMTQIRQFKGIVYDIEPQQLELWNADPGKYMRSLAEHCCTLYKRAQENNLKMIVCIPNYYDNPGLYEHLEQIVSKGCDAIAVMNYNKKDEVGNIEGEFQLAEKYDKAIINITEMQEPGEHELTSINTYYYDGFPAVRKSWDNIRGQIRYEKLGFSWHYIEPVLELMEFGGLI